MQLEAMERCHLAIEYRVKIVEGDKIEEMSLNVLRRMQHKTCIKHVSNCDENLH